ncbi:MAG: GGDEF domain-containing protein [Leptolyngbyaceae cyanobacterium SM2_3_12]|nr:GGDEF domain-containing protein [Leptolyngbyaceae cyanobacterium SM2_3_12]
MVITCSAIYAADGTISSWLWLVRDMTLQKQLEAMRQLAFYDALTGLPNRALFNDRFNHALAVAQRRQEMMAVVFLDIDRYKGINDTFGHAVGDRVLQELAHRIQHCLRNQDTVARWGGDEFTLILNPVESTQAAAQVVERMIASLQSPFEIQGYSLQVRASFGVALFPQASDNPDTLLRYADIALYQAKNEGNGYQFYCP